MQLSEALVSYHSVEKDIGCKVDLFWLSSVTNSICGRQRLTCRISLCWVLLWIWKETCRSKQKQCGPPHICEECSIQYSLISHELDIIHIAPHICEECSIQYATSASECNESCAKSGSGWNESYNVALRIYVLIYIYTYVYTYIYTYIHTHICTYICIHVFLNARTHTYRHKWDSTQTE